MKTCPKCGKINVVPILYGLPDSSVFPFVDKGVIHLGGCVLFGDDPLWRCLACQNEWMEEDFAGEHSAAIDKALAVDIGEPQIDVDVRLDYTNEELRCLPEDGQPCPHCGKPLRTDKAKQCFECGTDWHDPNNVVRRKII